MNGEARLSDDEFVHMLRLLKRYVTTEMDQWELWTFDTPRSKIFVDISMYPSHPGKAANYTNLNHHMTPPSDG